MTRAVKDAGNRLIWASDEFGSGLVHALNPKDKEWRGFRATLNSYYTGSSLSKAYSSRESVTSDNVSFSICGSTQPQPYAEILEKLLNTSDGLIDRFLSISAPAIVHYWPMATSKCVETISEDWPCRLFTMVYDAHDGAPGVTYSLSEEALEELKVFII